MIGMSGSTPLPQSHPLLERDDQIHELERYLVDSTQGAGSLVLLGGQAGIGKTALVREFCRRAQEQARVLVGACDSLSTQEPLAPLFDIVDALDADSRRRFQRARTRLERFRAFLELLRDPGRPGLVVFEDVQWADEATLDLLRYVGRRIGGAHSLLIATYRNDEVGPDHPLRTVFGDLATLGTTRRMTLQPLSEEAVDALAADSDVDAAELHHLTAGNPFFVTEVLAAGVGVVPATVRDAVLARASRLSPDAQAALRTAAVVGSQAEVWLLARLIEDSQHAIDECIEAGMLLAQSETFSFRHEIARQAILGSLAPRLRSSLHERALSALESSPEGHSQLARLAYHAEAGGNREAVLRYAPEAARSSSVLRAHREAAEQFRRAHRFADGLPAGERAQLLEEYAQECYLTDQLDASIEARRTALDLRRELGDHLREGENLYRLARNLILAGRGAEGEEASRQAIELLEEQSHGPELAAAYQIQAHLRMLNRDNAEAIEQGLRAIELAEQFDAREALAYAHNSVGCAMLFSGDDSGIAYLERSAQLAREADLDDYVASALGNLGTSLAEIYQFEMADRYLTEGIEFCDERDLDFDRNYMLSWKALSYLYQGRWGESGEVASELLRLPGLAAISRIMAHVALGRLRTRRGDPEAQEILDEALETAEQTATLQRLGPVHAARAEAAWLRGDREQALREARAVYDLAVRQRHPWHSGELAYWRWKAGDLTVAPDEAAEPYTLQIAGEWAQAAQAWEALGCPYEAARARLDSGDEESLRTALAEFEALGAGPARAEAAHLLRQIGARSIPRGARPSTQANPAGLTNRQVDVARLLAGGSSNLEIAEQLFISPKTVEHHISAILAKLDVDNRVDAAREINRLDLDLSPPK